MQQRSKNRFVNYAASIFVGTLFFLLSACATGPKIENHGFEFDARWDSPGTEILNFQYGESRQHGARPSTWQLERNGVPQQISTHGEMLRGNFLYVKWRNQAMGKVYEDTVDLRDRLPPNITNHKIRFVVKDAQLYVFLISPKKLQPNPCKPRDEMNRIAKTGTAYDMVFSRYCSLKITQIYPDLIKN